MNKVLTALKDPELVWGFQSAFGITKCVMNDTDSEGPWLAVEDEDVGDSPVHSENNGLSIHPPQDSCQHNGVGAEIKPNKNGAVTVLENEEQETDRLRKRVGEVKHTENGCGKTETRNVIKYKIRNRFWYLLFLFGSQLGDETGGALLFSFWFWNIDGSVGRRVIFVWNIIMYIGMGLKDVFRWTRPSMPPVVQMEEKSSLEYGMPSTHAMVGLAVPSTLVVFTMVKHELNLPLMVLIVCTWCCLVCCSRLYLGMHSVADIVVGLVLSAALLPGLLFIADSLDPFLVTSPLAPLFTVFLSLLAIKWTPQSDRWTPARGISTCCLGIHVGTHLGIWLNFQWGILQANPHPLVQSTSWSMFDGFGSLLLRTLLGGVIGVATRSLVKPSMFKFGCWLLGTDKETLDKQKFHLDNEKKVAADLFYKFMTYTAIGVNCVFLAPMVFSWLGCERADFYIEL